MSYTYLTVSQVVGIHADAIQRFKGTLGMRDKDALESALGRLRSGYYNNLIEEASALLESLAVNHPFIDGNKRTAFYATDAFLELNGFRIDCDPNKGDEFVRSVVLTKQDRFDRIVDWLTSHTKPYPILSKKQEKEPPSRDGGSVIGWFWRRQPGA